MSSDFSESTKEMQWQRSSKTKIKNLKDTAFGFQNLLLSVSLIRNEDKFVDIRGVHFFKFGSNEQTSNSNQLKLLSHHRGLTLFKLTTYIYI